MSCFHCEGCGQYHDICNPVISQYKTRTVDYGLRTGYKRRTQYKTRTKHYNLGIKYGLSYNTQTEHYGLGIKHEERHKIQISYQVIMVYQGNGHVTW